MKRLTMNIMLIAVLSILGVMWTNSDILAQQSQVQEQLREMNVEIPFIDKDGDGINDLMQNGWGLRFLQRYRNRKAMWTQLMEDEEWGTQLIDTDGDGEPDTALRDIVGQRLNQLIDTDGDGIADTPWGEIMRRRFQMFDQDGDGVPDEMTPEQMRQHFQEMREWRQQIKENLRNGLPAFTDEDGDGIPDDLPEGLFGWWRRHKRGGGS